MATVLVVKKTSAGYQVWDLETNTAVFASEFEDTANAYAANGQMTTEAFNKYRQIDINKLNDNNSSENTPVTPVQPATTPIPVTNYSGGAVSYQNTDTPEARQSLDKLQAQVDANKPTYERVWVKSDLYQGGGYYDLKEVSNPARDQTLASASSNTAGDTVNNSNNKTNPATQNTGKDSIPPDDLAIFYDQGPAPQPSSKTPQPDSNNSGVTPSGGSPITWQDIFNLNKDQIKNPNLIYPDQVLKMPDGSNYTVAPGDYLIKIANTYNSKLNKSDKPATPKADDKPQPKKEEKKIDPVKTIQYSPTPNPLHRYTSYTYGISLHLLSANDYKKLVNNPNDISIGATLISSAMRYKTSRDPAFKDDFYFDNLKMTTVVALNANTKGSNMVDLKFTIIEPYGMTLMDRILDINTTKMNAKNYLEMPYMLEINFFGGDDQGNMQMLPDQTKFIPIRIVDMKIRASTKGAEYTIAAVPYNHQGNFYSVQAIKANFEVQATTVADFFKNGTGSSGVDKQAIVAGVSQVNDKSRNTTPNTNSAPNNTDPAKSNSRNGKTPPSRKTSNNTPNNGKNTNMNTSAPTVKAQSFTMAYNAWNEQVKLAGYTSTFDTIAFEIDPIIAKGKVIVPKKVGSDKAGNTTGGGSTDAGKNTQAKGNDPKTNSATPAAGLNLNSQYFAINAGTAILSVIDMVVTNSSFIRDQLTDVEGEAAQNKAASSGANLSKAKGNRPVQWYKVIPKVELKEFDSSKNKWAKHVTFYVKPFLYYNTGKDPRLPEGAVPGYVKDYQYIYTGHNMDIIDFDMDFNTLFYTAIQVNRKTNESIIKDANAGNSQSKGKTEIKAGGEVVPVQSDVSSVDNPDSAVGAGQRSETRNAQSAKNSVYSGAAGDMLNLNLRIIGDPDFIKQDDILYNPGVTGLTPDKQFVKGNSGSLNMDSGEIYCKVTFNTPVDVDDQTGLLRKNSKYFVSSFSGDYKVMTVDSEFRQGKFTQTLSMIRQMKAKVAGATSPSVTQRNTDKDTNNKTNSSRVPGQNGGGGQATIINGKVTSALDPNAWGDDSRDERPPPQPTGQATIIGGQVTSALDPTAWGDGTFDVSPNQQALREIGDNGETRPIGNNNNSDGTPIVQNNSNNQRIAEIEAKIRSLKGQVNYLLQGQDPATLQPGTETYKIYQELQNSIAAEEGLLVQLIQIQ